MPGAGSGGAFAAGGGSGSGRFHRTAASPKSVGTCLVLAATNRVVRNNVPAPRLRDISRPTAPPGPLAGNERVPEAGSRAIMGEALQKARRDYRWAMKWSPSTSPTASPRSTAARARPRRTVEVITRRIATTSAGWTRAVSAV